MLPETELLQYIHKTADMGCTGLRAVISRTDDKKLQGALLSQHGEYLKLQNEASNLLRARHERAKGVGYGARLSARMMTAGELALNGTVSHIAEMTVRGNSAGMAKSIRHLHDYKGKDTAVRQLAEKLIATEEANIQQMKAFL